MPEYNYQRMLSFVEEFKALPPETQCRIAARFLDSTLSWVTCGSLWLSRMHELPAWERGNIIDCITPLITQQFGDMAQTAWTQARLADGEKTADFKPRKN